MLLNIHPDFRATVVVSRLLANQDPDWKPVRLMIDTSRGGVGAYVTSEEPSTNISISASMLEGRL